MTRILVFYVRISKIDDRVEDTAFEPAAREPREESLDRVQSGTGGRCEVEDEARMAAQPAQSVEQSGVKSGILTFRIFVGLTNWST